MFTRFFNAPSVEKKRRDTALNVLHELVFRDEDPHIRGGQADVPVLVDPQMANALADGMKQILNGPEGMRPGYHIISALESVRQATPSRKRELIAPLISDEHYLADAGEHSSDALYIADAISKAGPFDLSGACYLLDLLLANPSYRDDMRSAAYYVAGNDKQAEILIRTVGREVSTNVGHREARERLMAINAALDSCGELRLLKGELGRQAVALSRALGSGTEADALRREVAGKVEPELKRDILNSHEGVVRLFIVDEKVRPCPTHQMLPVFIEPRMESQAEDSSALFALIREHLKLLVGESGQAPMPLLRELLKQRRVLIILDGFSEFSTPARDSYRSAISQLSVNACVISSRDDTLVSLSTAHAEL